MYCTNRPNRTDEADAQVKRCTKENLRQDAHPPSVPLLRDRKGGTFAEKPKTDHRCISIGSALDDWDSKIPPIGGTGPRVQRIMSEPKHFLDTLKKVGRIWVSAKKGATNFERERGKVDRRMATSSVEQRRGLNPYKATFRF